MTLAESLNWLDEQGWEVVSVLGEEDYATIIARRAKRELNEAAASSDGAARDGERGA